MNLMVILYINAWLLSQRRERKAWHGINFEIEFILKLFILDYIILYESFGNF